jgi:hypothetical protein
MPSQATFTIIFGETTNVVKSASNYVTQKIVSLMKAGGEIGKKILLEKKQSAYTV